MSRFVRCKKKAGLSAALSLLLFLAGCTPPLVPTAAPPPPTNTLPPTALPREPTPMPTAPTAKPTGEVLLRSVVYEHQGNLWLYDGQVSRPLTRDGRSFGASISPDGGRVLFHRHEDPTPLSLYPMSLWLLDLATGRETSVDLSILPTERASTETGEEVDLPRWPAQEVWLPDGSGVLFSTAPDYSTVGIGWKPGDDLWLIDAGSGQVHNLLPEREPPARFTLSPDGQRLLWSRPERIEVMDLHSGERRTLLEFPFVLTYSEYAWLPEPRWLSDGRTALVAIAPPDPAESRTYTLFRLDVATGTSQRLGQVEGSIFLWSPSGDSWSPDGQWLVYFQGEGNERAIILANADGSGEMEVARTQFPTLLGWSPDGQNFFYEERGKLYALRVDREGRARVQPVGEVGGAPERTYWHPAGLFLVAGGRLWQVPVDGLAVRQVSP